MKEGIRSQLKNGGKPLKFCWQCCSEGGTLLSSPFFKGWLSSVVGLDSCHLCQVSYHLDGPNPASAAGQLLTVGAADHIHSQMWKHICTDNSSSLSWAHGLPGDPAALHLQRGPASCSCQRLALSLLPASPHSTGTACHSQPGQAVQAHSCSLESSSPAHPCSSAVSEGSTGSDLHPEHD